MLGEKQELFDCCHAGFQKCCGNLRGKDGFPFLKEAVIFPHGKAALFVGTVVVFLSLIDRGLAAGTLLKSGKATVKKLYSPKTGKTYDGTVLLADTGGKYVNYKVTISKDKELE